MSLRFRLAIPLALLCLVPALAPGAAHAAQPGAAAATQPGAAHADPAPAWCARPQPWCDQTLDPDRRADLLAADLTGDEKLQLLAGGGPGVLPTVPRPGLAAGAFTDG